MLTERFHVALPTLRQALGILRAEGLIESRHGIGTFVKNTRRRQRRSRNRYGRARDGQQLLSADLEHRIIYAGPEVPPPYVAEIMGVPPGGEVVVRRRHLHDKATGALEEIGVSYIPSSIATGTYLEEATVVPKALFLCIEELSGQTYTHARDAWVSRLPSGQEADLFALAPGAPVLHVTHTARSGSGDVVEVSESVWPADRMMFLDEYDIPEHGTSPDARSDI